MADVRIYRVKGLGMRVLGLGFKGKGFRSVPPTGVREGSIGDTPLKWVLYGSRGLKF